MRDRRRSALLWLVVGLACSSPPAPEGGEPADSIKAPPEGQSEPLPREATEALLKKLPALPADAEGAKDFSLRGGSLPAPKPGKVLPFTPPTGPEGAPAVETGPLTVLRYSPEGAVKAYPNLSITFSQPMAALGELNTPDPATRPATISPEPPGQWRWLGSRTLLFEPKDRFPMATDYRVTVPGTARSLGGASVSSPLEFSFQTPAPTLTRTFPQPGETGVADNTLVFLGFDQAIKPEAVLAALTGIPAGNSLRQVTLDEAQLKERSESLAWAVKNAPKDSYVLLEFAAPLAKNTAVTLTLPPGSYSAEGQKATSAAQSLGFTVYGPLRVSRALCGWDTRDCDPNSEWEIELSNLLDPKAFAMSQVTVSPAVEEFRCYVSGNFLNCTGEFAGRTKYTLTLAPELKDVFGQTLGAPATVNYTTTAAPRSLEGPAQQLLVLDPQGGGKIAVHSTNFTGLEVSLYEVGPEHWKGFYEYNSYYSYSNERRPPVPGRLVSTQKVEILGPKDEDIETLLDLSPALPGGRGQVLVHVVPTDPLPPVDDYDNPDYYYGPRELNFWAQSTGLGVDAVVSNEEVLAFVGDINTGKALAGVELELYPGGAKASTDQEGLAVLPLRGPGLFSSATPYFLLARKDGDSALLTSQVWGGLETYWQRQPIQDSLAWYVIDDRQLYKPGEEANIKGFVRHRRPTEAAELFLGELGQEIKYVLTDSRGNKISEGKAPLSKLGGFSFSLKFPDEMNLGYASLQLEAANSNVGGFDDYRRRYFHNLRLEEFRRPEFEVKAQAPEGPQFLNGKAEMVVNASYYAGGPLPGSEVTWSVNFSATSFTPPNQDGYTFGDSNSFGWGYGGSSADSADEWKPLSESGVTDAQGQHVLPVELKPRGKDPVPYRVSGLATVMDLNRQAWNASASFLVHPSDRYVGLKTDKPFTEAGEPVEVSLVVVDLDGKPVAGRAVELVVARREWVTKTDGSWGYEERDPEAASLTSGTSALKHSFTPKKGGTYFVKAVVTDEQGRKNQSVTSVWVAGEEENPDRTLRASEIRLSLDKDEYKDGDIAKLLVASPFAPAEGVVMVLRDGILEPRHFSMSKPTTILEIPVKGAWAPNAYVSVLLAGQQKRGKDLPGTLPAFASNSVYLNVPVRDQKLSVEATPKKSELAPGSQTSISVAVKDSAGKPVKGAEVALIVVDESILGLAGISEYPDPVAAFFPGRGAGASTYQLRSQLWRADQPEAPEEQMAPVPPPPPPPLGGEVLQNARLEAPMPSGMPAAATAPAEPMSEGAFGGVADGKRDRAKNAEELEEKPLYLSKKGIADGDSATGTNMPAQGPSVALRADFAPLALFSAELPTDAKGKTTVKLTLPDNLTRYRIIAVAAAGERQFGKGESTLTAKAPLMVRPSPPRFLRFGDEAVISVLVQNQTDKPQVARVALRAQEGLSLQGEQGYITNIPANDRMELRFPVKAARAGEVTFQVIAASSSYKDASQLSFPVYTPATTEAQALYGELDEGAVAQELKLPNDIATGFGGLEVTATSTAVGALADALLYVYAYPYECAEQVSSRVLSIAALKDVLGAFKAEGLPPSAVLNAAVLRDLAKLRGMQNYDGGFGFWRAGERSWPYLSLHVAHALARAKQKGYTVPEDMLSLSTQYLRNVEYYLDARQYNEDSRASIVAYSLYVLRLLDQPNPDRARRLVSERGVDKLHLEAIGWILPTLAADPGSATEYQALLDLLKNRVSETAGAAHFVTSYDESQGYLLLSSDRRADALLLEALIQVDPKNDLIVKLVKGLLDHRKAGHWGSTQEDAFVLVALDRYFNTYEKVEPDFVAKLWLGQDYAGEQAFKGRSTEQRSLVVPMSELVSHPEQPIIVSKEGAGRLYYRIGLRYAPSNFQLPPAEYGFTVERRYEAVDRPEDVTRDQDGTWRIKPGARVKVTLTMVAPARRYHVALVDQIPAGLEAENPALGVSRGDPYAPMPLDSFSSGEFARSWYGWGWTWYEHQNLRDERVEAFASLLWDGVYTYSYTARATTPGTFIVPPAKAEEMYAPETFGRSASAKVIVEAPADGL